jgi:hypothetical protein
MELDRNPAGALGFFSLEFLDLGSWPGFSREKEALPFAGGHVFESEMRRRADVLLTQPKKER